MEKEGLKDQCFNFENKFRDLEILVTNLKQQNIRNECVIKAKEDAMYQIEKQVEEYKIRFKQANDDADRYELQLKDSDKTINELQQVKEDIEAKVIS